MYPMPQIGTPQMAPKPDGMADTAQAITAAMLMAAKSNCSCQVCQILRGVIDKMAAPFLPGSGGAVPGG